MNKNLDIFTDKLNFRTFIFIAYLFFFKKNIRVFLHNWIKFSFFKKFKSSKKIKLIDISKFHESRFFIKNKSLFQLIYG